jgi:hypothetical protein
MSPQENKPAPADDANEDRRKFLVSCGKFAAVTPPVITMLLSTSLNSTAIARSGGRWNDGNDRDRDPRDRGDRHSARDWDFWDWLWKWIT